MSVKERILAIRLSEKIRLNPEYAKKIGVSVEIKQQQFQKKHNVTKQLRSKEENNMARYHVDFKSFSTGEWYTKTDTDSIASAYSVAKIGNYGRACRLIDTASGEILYETPEEDDFKAVKGNVSKFRNER